MPRVWQWIALALGIVLVVGIGMLVFDRYGFNLADSHRMIVEQIRNLGLWGHLAIICLMVVHSFVPFPAEFVALAAGASYGVVYGTFLTWLGAMIGAMLSFWLTRFFGRPFVNMFLPARQLGMLDRWTNDQGAMTLLISRFIPIISFNLVNYAAGLTRIKWWTFVWTTGLGILPLTSLMVYMGSRMQDLSWSWLLGLSITGILLMAALHVFMRSRMPN